MVKTHSDMNKTMFISSRQSFVNIALDFMHQT